MTAASRNALHVLRLVLRGQQDVSRRAYTATLAVPGDTTAAFQYDSNSAGSSSKTMAPSVSASAIEHPDFVEDGASEEYAQAEISLSRFPAKPRALRWPTVFAPKLVHERDALPDLVRKGDHVNATKTLKRLLDAGSKPLNLKIYMAMAELSLKQGNKEDFLEWLSVYPRTPPTFLESSLHLTCRRITGMIRTEHGYDIEFVRRCLMLSAQKGLLPSTMLDLTYHLTRKLPALDSLDIIHEAIKKYYAGFDKYGTISPYACKLRSIADSQSTLWWNKYCRYLMTSGHEEEARLLYARMLVGDWYVRPNEATRVLMDQSGEKQTTSATRRKQTAALIKSMRLALKNGATYPLQEALTLLEPYATSHPTLAARFKRRWLKTKNIPERNRQVRIRHLIRAEILAHAIGGRHREAVEHFQSKYRWVGIPPHPAAQSIKPIRGRVLGMATINDVNAILPSLMFLLGDKSAVQKFFDQYFRQFAQYPRALLPFPSTWKLFIHHITQICGIEQGERALRIICKANIDPGAVAFTSFMDSLFRAGKMEEADTLLNGMLNRRKYHGIALPEPTIDTLHRLQSPLQYAMMNGYVPGPVLYQWVESLSEVRAAPSSKKGSSQIKHKNTKRVGSVRESSRHVDYVGEAA